MPAVHRQYTRELYAEFHYFATWMPNVGLSLGDVGVLRDHRFDRMTSLTEMGVSFTSLEHPGRAEYSYSSTGKVEISVDGALSAPALPGGDSSVALTVAFSDACATYFRAAQCRSAVIGELPKLARDLRELRQAGEWRPEYVVVTEVVRAGPAVVLVSNQAGARARLRVTADSLPVPGIGAGGGLGASVASGLAASVIVADGEVTPLFRAAKLRRARGTNPRLIVRGPAADPGLVGASWDDFAGDPDTSGQG